ncbi:MAG: hypothetical protein JWM69_517, partial [Candidatus Binatus sp.]|nr:hypothetical protein [Candidatus Binatus sp.]
MDGGQRETSRSKGGRLMTVANTAADIPTMPLPWPTPEISAREAR